MNSNINNKSGTLLKACIFATGLSGIIAEYVMATLASYLLGNAVLQWTLTVSTMLFAMGVGSRLSKHFMSNLLESFIVLELALSLVCAFSAVGVYLTAGYVEGIGPVIYAISFLIGLLIGMEIPLAARINDKFEEFRVNISSVMEKDYYGALLGGVLFAFVLLPKLGLTYTPILLAAVNFSVAFALFIRSRKTFEHRKLLTVGCVSLPIILAILAVAAKPIVLYGEQRKYRDLIVYEEQTPYQRIVVTKWKDDHWLYLDGNEQFSSYDEELYHEPLVHPAMGLSVARKRILILGGGDGLAAREVLKYPEVEEATLVDLDPGVTRLGRENAIFLELNKGSLNDARVKIENKDAQAWLADNKALYDVIIIDLPDPKTVALARLYSLQFYRLAKRSLAKGGTLVTQATSPFFSRDAFLSIFQTMTAAGFSTVAYQNHIPTLGQWSWVLGINAPELSSDEARKRLLQLNFSEIETRYLDKNAMVHMLHFGKGIFDGLEEIKINDEIDLAIYHYYKNGAWDIY